MQSPCTLREAETKKGRCSVSGNDPLMYSRLLDVVADVAFVARTLDAETSFRKCWEKSITSERNPIFPTKPQVVEGCDRGLAPRSPFYPALPDRRKIGALMRLVWTVI